MASAIENKVLLSTTHSHGQGQCHMYSGHDRVNIPFTVYLPSRYTHCLSHTHTSHT